MKLATLCYLRRNGKTLMLHRNKNPEDFQYGKYNGLGGKFKEGENPEECVIREVEEESGLIIRNPRLRGIMTFDNRKRSFHEGNTQPTWYVLVYTADDFSGELKDTKEGTLEWIANSDLLELDLYDGDKIFMQWLDSPKVFSAKFTYEGDNLVNHEVVFY